MKFLVEIRANRDYWLYFFSVLLSLVGIDLFVYTQGWYVLQLTGSHLSVGFSWSIFFTPSLFLLPIMGSLLDSPGVKKVLITFEFLKSAILLLFIPILYLMPSIYFVYLMSALFGIFFSTFYPSIYVVLKKVVPTDLAAKYSHLFELSIQVASMIAMALAGLLYVMLGFLPLIAMGSLLLIFSALIMTRIHIKQNVSFESIHLLNEYKKFFDLFKIVFGRKNDNRRTYLFGVLHQFPQNIILAINIPILLYVYNVMKKGPYEYGMLDSVAGLAAFLAGIFWTKYYKKGQSKKLLVSMSLLTVLSFLLIAILHPKSILPYGAFFLMSLFLTSSKIQCRAAVLMTTPAEVMGRLTAFYQTISYALMIMLAFATSYLCYLMSINTVFAFFALLMSAFTLFIIWIYQPESESLSA